MCTIIPNKILPKDDKDFEVWYIGMRGVPRIHDFPIDDVLVLVINIAHQTETVALGQVLQRTHLLSEYVVTGSPEGLSAAE